MITLCWECGHPIHNLERVTTWLKENGSKGMERVFAHQDCRRDAAVALATLLLPVLALVAGLANAGRRAA